MNNVEDGLMIFDMFDYTGLRVAVALVPKVCDENQFSKLRKNENGVLCDEMSNADDGLMKFLIQKIFDESQFLELKKIEKSV